jgi:hypothetical protein
LYTCVRRSAKIVGVVSAEVVEDFDHAALLGDEDAAVGGELERRRLQQAGEDRCLAEVRRAGGELTLTSLSSPVPLASFTPVLPPIIWRCSRRSPTTARSTG